MNLFKKLFKRKQKRQFADVHYHNVTGQMFYGNRSPLKVPVVLATINILAQDISRLPLHVYQHTDDNGLKKVNSPLNYLLSTRSNAITSAYSMRFVTMYNVLLHGNAYVYIVRDGRGNIKELVPVDPYKVTMKVQGTTITYNISTFGIVPAKSMLHFFAFTANGYSGISTIELMDRNINNLTELDLHSKNAIKNRSTLNFAIQTPISTKEDLDAFATNWDEKYSKEENAGKTPILPKDVTVQELGISQADVEMIESKKFEMRNWASIMRVPPHLIGDLEKGNYSNITAMSLSYVKYTLQPHLTMIEQEMNHKLLGPRQSANGYFIDHNVNSILRGDTQQRTDKQIKFINHGIYTINEVRDEEGLERIDDPACDGRYIQLNRYDILNGRIEDVPSEKKELFKALQDVYQQYRYKEKCTTPLTEKQEEQRKRISMLLGRFLRDHQKLYANIYGEVYNRLRTFAIDETTYQKDALQSYLMSNDEEMTQYFIELGGDTVREILYGIKNAIVKGFDPDTFNIAQFDTFVESYVKKWGLRVHGKEKTKILSLITEDKKYNEGIDRLQDAKYITINHKNEITRERNASTYASFRSANIQTFTVVNTGKETCPFCKSLAGQTYRIQIPIIEKDQVITVGDESYTSHYTRFHPPFHDSCDCDIVAN